MCFRYGGRVCFSWARHYTQRLSESQFVNPFGVRFSNLVSNFAALIIQALVFIHLPARVIFPEQTVGRVVYQVVIGDSWVI